MTFVLPTIHPRQLIRGAFGVALKEQDTLAGEKVFLIDWSSMILMKWNPRLSVFTV